MAAARKTTARKSGKKRSRAKAREPVGLDVGEVPGKPPAATARLAEKVSREGHSVLGAYRDPLGGHWLLLVAVPVDRVEPTPYQRDASKPHVQKIARVMEKVDRFLDPIILSPCRGEDGRYWTPNGNHRLQALKSMNARTVVGLLVPESDMAHQILALNTEKAYNLREKSLGVLRLLRNLAGSDDVDPAGRPWRERTEESLAFELEEPSLVTLGAAYEQRPRLGGSAYQPVLRRVDAFLAQRLPEALEIRTERAGKLLEVDDAVSSVVDRLKERGFQSPYLRPFVVARINPIRFHKGEPPPLEKTLDKMLTAATRFNVDRVRQEEIARSGGPPAE